MTSSPSYSRGFGGVILNQAQVAELTVLRDAQASVFQGNEAGLGIGVPLYTKLLEFISTNTASGDVDDFEMRTDIAAADQDEYEAVWTWLKGATSVNAGEGFQADFIREYTKIQYQLREGDVADAETRNQTASNEIAFAVVNDILVNGGSLPGIEGLGVQDAGRAASTVFTTDSLVDGDYAPWAGALLFPFLGHDAFFEDWVLSNEVVNGSLPDGTNVTFKNVEGTYDFVSILQAGYQASINAGLENNWEAFLALFGITDAIDNDHGALVQAANQYFWNTYALTGDDGFSPGDDLVLAGPINTAISDNYLVGTLGDDLLSAGNAIHSTGFTDVINAGWGDDDIVAMAGSAFGGDLIDGGAGTDTVYFGDDPLDIGQDQAFEFAFSSIAGSDLFEFRIEVNGGLAPTYLYDIERIVSGDLSDRLIINELTPAILDKFEWIDLGAQEEGLGDVVDVSSMSQNVLLTVQANQDLQLALADSPSANLTIRNAEVFRTGSGNDVIDATSYVGSAILSIDAGAGNDVVRGSGVGASVYGGAGDDTLYGGMGIDTLDGGAGLDVADYSAHAGGVEIAFGGTSVAPTLKVSGGTAGTDDLFLIEKIIGTAVRDTIKISGEIPSGTAVEIDLGGGQASTVTDVIDLSGASGAMAVQVAANGLGSIQAKDGSGGSITLRNAEVEVIGSAHDDEITLTDVAGTVSGGGGHDLLQGGALDDALSGGEGDDVIRGGGANDTLNGGSGLNSLYGEDGNDILTGGQNTDTLEGGTGDDQLFGGVGHDSLDGGADNDTLTGGTGNDSLFGGGGDDILYGGDQDDTLVGGEGADQLTGGAGSDQFHVGGGDIVQDAELLDSLYFGGRLLAGAIRKIQIEDGVEKYETPHLIGAHGERYEISGDVQPQNGTGITVTIHLQGGGTVVLNDYQQGDGGIYLYDEVTTTTEKNREGYGQAGQLISPLVLDLDGDGVELTGLTSSQTYFDLDGDGFAEKTGWVGGGDGLLALDRNGNGDIDDITELFGNAITDGFTELALLDSDGDGVIDAADTEFANLRVWIDSDRDGTSNAGELKTLSELEIESISLAATEVSQTQLGNEISHISSYTRSDGSQHEIVDAWFANDQLDSRYLGDTNVSAEVAALANLRGTGELADLQVASENDAVLKGLVAELATLQVADIAGFSERVEAILFRWAGTQGQAQDSRGPYVDGRQLVTMEKIFGQPFFQAQNVNSANPDINASNALSAVWLQIVADTGAKLLLQSGQSGLFGGTASYDFDADLIVNSATAIDFQALADAAPLGAADKAAYWQSLVPMIQSIASATGLQAESYSGLLSETLIDSGVLLTLEELMISTPLSGGLGDDSLTGTSGRDLLDGGQGNDVLAGGEGGDVYVFARGGGQDIINEVEDAVGLHKIDRLELLDIASTDVTLARNGNDLILKVNGSDDQVTITRQFFVGNLGPYTPLRVDHEIEAIHFSDGVIWDEQRIREELLTATDGDDTLTGFFARDRLDGGAGNDLLLGGDEADTYVFDVGYGQDEIYDDMMSVFFRDPDIVSFGAGITQENITFSRGTGEAFDNLIIDVVGTTDRLTIRDNFFAGNLGNDGGLTVNNKIEEFHFADGTKLTDQEVRQILLTSTDGDDTLIGFFDADTLDGGAGNDRLEGGNVGDTYIFDAGYGHDVIEDYMTSIFFPSPDIVSFGAGILAENVKLARSGDLWRDLTITFEGLSDSLTIENIFFTSFYEIEEFHFANGEVWNLDDVRAKLVTGTDGDDILRGFDTADTLYGGRGNDRLEGSSNSDTYIFNLGDGQDVIYDFQSSPAASGPDIISFGAGISAGDLTLTRTGFQGRDMLITINGSSDSIRVEDMLFSTYREVEEFHFADGMVWTLADIWGALLGATEGNDNIIGTGNADFLSGAAGDDTLTGKGGNDSLIGGKGNDTLYGGDESDTYIFARGDGVDVIEDNGFADTDRLIICGYTPAEVILGQAASDSNHLVISFVGSGDQITVRNALGNNVGDNIEEYVFDDDTVWTPDDLRSMILESAQTDGDDVVRGFDTSDRLEGGLGDDELRGGDGSDDYVFTRGDGVDVIEDEGYLSTDRLVLHGYSPDEVMIGRSSPTSNDAVLTFTGTGDRITIINTLNGGAFDVIEEIVFDGGTIWTPADLRAALLTGGDGNDALYGFDTSDTLDGGLGNDRMEGGFGQDIYIFDVGYGADVIRDAGLNSEFDKVIFGAGILASDLALSYSPADAEDLVIEVISTGDTLTIERMFGNSGYHIESFEFADGSSWTRGHIQALVDVVDPNAPTHEGTAGDDVINGTANDDIFAGRGGDDTLNSNGGNDTFLYASGDGNDVINEDSYSTTLNDVLKFTDLNAADLTFSRVGIDLMIAVNATGHVIEVDEQFYSTRYNYGIEVIEFADGTAWDRSEIQSNAWIRGTSGADSLTGSSGDDVFVGGTGDDVIYSTAGSDTFIYASGDGSDKIDEENSSTSFTDVLKFTDLNASDISLSQIGNDLMVTVIATGHVIEVDEQFYSNTYHWGIEVIEFADGTRLNRDEIKDQVTAPAAPAAAPASDDLFAGFRTLRELFGDADSSDEPGALAPLSLADLIDDTSIESPESEIIALLDLDNGEMATPSVGSAGGTDLTSLAIADAALVMPEFQVEDYSSAQ